MYESVDISFETNTAPATRPESLASQAGGQERLALSAGNDNRETEANAMADRVMRMPEVSLQRKCAHCEEEEQVQLKPSIPFLQKKGNDGSGQAGEAVSQQINASRGNGNRMDANTQHFMESRFDADFSGVKIHTGNDAVQMSRELNAQAFTVGSDIYFNQGRYNPSSSEGKHLLAHELTHTVQQGGAIRQQKIQRQVNDANVVTTAPMLTHLGLTRQQVIETIRTADAGAIVLAQGAEDELTAQLAVAQGGGVVDANAELILTEELGLSYANPAHRRLIRQQATRFRRVRETLESGYLRYLGIGLGTVPLTGCQAGSCGTNFAFSCPGNRLIVLCQTFWDRPAEQDDTLLHEPFHIWFHMAHHNTNALRRADASCFESFALRVSGVAATSSCDTHTAG